MAVNETYAAIGRGIVELFADYVDGGADRPAIALSARPLGNAARNALEKSIESFGYATPACTFATLKPRAANVEGGEIELDAQALFTLVEGLDPLFVIAADGDAAKSLGRAYRIQLEPDTAARVFGRPAAIFNDLAACLETDEGKQRAWKVLKTLR